MARLTADQWEQARAEYEVRGVSLGEVAKRYGVVTSSVSRRAKTEGWTQGRLQDLAQKKACAVKELAEVQTKTQELAPVERWTLDEVVKEQLRAAGMYARLDQALASCALSMLPAVTTPEAWKLMTEGRRNLMPASAAPGNGVNVNVNQSAGAQAALAVPTPAPNETVRRALRGDYERDE